MKKVIPIITIILSIVALVAAGFALFFSCNALIVANGLGVAFLVMYAVVFTVPAFALSAINTCLSFVFSKSKGCRIAGIISAIALIISIVSFVLIKTI
ncbi:MAG: hypothetical protein E7350_00165 [Clostridiales bacterium]|nr:hypothetical protein [Clostridiales bacterium]